MKIPVTLSVGGASLDLGEVELTLEQFDCHHPLAQTSDVEVWLDNEKIDDAKHVDVAKGQIMRYLPERGDGRETWAGRDEDGQLQPAMRLCYGEVVVKSGGIEIRKRSPDPAPNQFPRHRHAPGDLTPAHPERPDAHCGRIQDPPFEKPVGRGEDA